MSLCKALHILRFATKDINICGIDRPHSYTCIHRALENHDCGLRVKLRVATFMLVNGQGRRLGAIREEAEVTMGRHNVLANHAQTATNLADSRQPLSGPELETSSYVAQSVLRMNSSYPSQSTSTTYPHIMLRGRFNWALT